MESKRVLQIDPCPDNRFLFRAVVSRRGHEIHEACSFADLKKTWRPNWFDLVLISLGHAGYSGSEACDYIREQDDSVPIFVYSSSANGETKHGTENDGLTGYYLKFDDFSRLIADIDRVLDSGADHNMPEEPETSPLLIQRQASSGR